MLTYNGTDPVPRVSAVVDTILIYRYNSTSRIGDTQSMMMLSDILNTAPRVPPKSVYKVATNACLRTIASRYSDSVS